LSLWSAGLDGVHRSRGALWKNGSCGICGECTQAREVLGARGAGGAFRTGGACLVHLPSDEVASWSVVASVQRCEPFAILVRSCSTANLVSLSPSKGSVVSSGGAELEWLDVILAEQGHLLVPVPDSCLPVVIRLPQTLFVDVQVLSNSKSANPTTVGTIVGKLALVSMGLGNH